MPSVIIIKKKDNQALDSFIDSLTDDEIDELNTDEAVMRSLCLSRSFTRKKELNFENI
jgi:hypothetical protein